MRAYPYTWYKLPGRLHHKPTTLRAKPPSPRSEVETSVPYLSKVLIGQNKQRAKKSPLFTASALEHRLVRGAEENLSSSYLKFQKLGTERDRERERAYNIEYA